MISLQETQRKLRVAVAENRDAKDFKWLDEMVASIYQEAEIVSDTRAYKELTEIYKFTKDLWGKHLSKDELYQELVNEFWRRRRELPANIEDIGEVVPGELLSY